MGACTTKGQARIQPRDFSAVLRANQLAGASLAGLERQRGCQAEVEVAWLLKQHSVTPPAMLYSFEAAAGNRHGVDSRWRPPRGHPPQCRLAESAWPRRAPKEEPLRG